MDSVREQLQNALTTTYRIDRELGGGGMSRVFLSTEIALDRQVVLKVLPEDLAGGVSVDRFKREISVAARLQHAHIVPLLSAGEANGLPWFSMPFVEGQSLRSRLARGELPIAEAVRILRDVASALSYAHGKGVVHRDIKPENILLAEGGAAVTDFGVAKAIADAGNHGGTDLTSIGVALGTPAYMAPEQAAGDTRTDHRADLYAFGVVAYELLAGRNPFGGRSAQQTLAAHMTEMPAPVEQSRTTTPPALAQLIARCLSKSAADRPQSASEIVNVLDSLATPTGSVPLTAAGSVAFPVPRSKARLALVAGIVLLLGASGLMAWRTLSAPTLDQRTVAVLPFDVVGNDTAVVQAARVAADWLSQGIVQTDSANVVASTLVSFAMADVNAGGNVIERVSRITRAGTIVTGSASRFGDSLRIQVSIVDARTGNVIRAIDPVTGPVSDPIIAINELRDRVLGSIVSGDVANSAAVAGQPPRYSAYKEYLQGMEIFPRSQANARPHLRRAIEIDSTFAAPYTGLAATFVNAGMRDSAAVVVAKLETFRDRLSPVSRLLLDYSHAMVRNSARDELRAAQEIVRRTSDPNMQYLVGLNANALLLSGVSIPALLASDSIMAAAGWAPNVTQLAEAYHIAGEHRKELEHLAVGRRRYPNNATMVNRRLRAYAGLRDSSSALALADTILRGNSNPGNAGPLGTIQTAAWEFEAHGDSVTGHALTRKALDWTVQRAPATRGVAWERSVGRALFDLGFLDSAAVHLKRSFPDTSTNGIASAAYLAIIQLRKGDSASARRTADSIGTIKRRWDLGTTAYWRAALLAELGERDQAVALLRTANQQGSGKAAWHYNLALKPLRGYPPFQELISPDK